ncbi:MAG: hypothetical protein IKH21_02760, partial [Clostridia bacterium]|nr:hypothetical protein [Clostridia bacterium]
SQCKFLPLPMVISTASPLWNLLWEFTNFLRIKANGYFEMPMIKHDNKKASQNGKLCNAALRSRY